MQQKILEYIEAHFGPMDSEDAVITWWQGLQDAAADTGAIDELTETLEFLEDQKFIEKQEIEKEFFIYRLIAKQ